MIPFDTTTLLLLAGMLVSLIADEAALYGDTLTLHINVAPKIAQAVSMAPRPGRSSWPNPARIVRSEPIIPTPTLRVS